MAQETNQSQAPLLCTTGCGFYGNPRTSGMCSVCYKEHLSRQNSGGLSPVGAGASGSSTTEPSAMQRLGACLSDAAIAADGSSSLTTASLPVTQRMTEMSISQEDKVVSVKSDPTEPVVSQPSASTSAAITASGDEGSPTEVPKLKKNRCFVCRKKVGLTGFACRCGSLFCGLHRYSDKHNCPYDYKAEAAAKIRKENPVVVADKIQRI